jgi:imidazolonepropionase-like amidohydrolase
MSQTTAINNVRVFNGVGLTDALTVLIRDGQIVESGTPETVFDARDRTLLPGLIDAHFHLLRGRSDLDDLSRWGVTTGLDMAAWPLETVTAMRTAVGVADLRSATIPAVGVGSRAACLPGFPAEGIISTPAEGRAFIQRRVADSADYIKVLIEDAPPSGMDQKTLDAIVGAAHDHDKQVVAHSVTVGAFHVALDAGVDIITHAPLDAVLDDESLAVMAATSVACIPTLTMMQHMAQETARRAAGWDYQNARDTVTALHDAGVAILVGTDAHVTPSAPAALRPGQSIHHEFELLGEAGLTPVEVLESATILTAEVFGLTDRGAIESGKRADLLLINGDPTHDITDTRNIAAVWIAGQRLPHVQAC